MDWATPRLDWNRLKVFLAVAEEGSFSAAGRVLQMSQPTVGRQIASLEDELEVALFERVGRSMQLTPTGLDMIEHARIMGEAAARVALIAEGQSLSLDGDIRITAGEVIAIFVLPPIVEQIRAEYPGIQVEIVATNQPSDLLRREADIAIRNFQAKEPELVARKVKESRAWMYASPDYLRTLDDPDSLEGLAQADFIGFDRTDVFMKGLNAMGLPVTESSFPIVSTTQMVQWEMVKRGNGIGIMMEEIGDREPRVVRVPHVPAYPVPLWLTSHRELRTSRKVRVVFDALAAALAAS